MRKRVIPAVRATANHAIQMLVAVAARAEFERDVIVDPARRPAKTGLP